MALVPWVYNNPRTVMSDRHSSRQFIFGGKVIKVLQDAKADIDVTKNTDLRLWDGAFLLSRYFENQDVFPAGFWNGKRCLELGAGCGLVGIVAWLLGADVTLTDMSTEHTRRCVDENVSRLAASDPILADKKAAIRVQDYVWGDKYAKMCTSSGVRYDIIIGSDIVYSADAAVCLVDALQTFCVKNTLVLLSYKARNLGEDIFFQKLKDSCFIYEKVLHNFHPIDFKNSDYEIFRISRPDCS